MNRLARHDRSPHSVGEAEWALHPGLQRQYASETALIFEVAERRIPFDFFYRKRVLVIGHGIHRFLYVANRAGVSSAVGIEMQDGPRTAQLAASRCCRTVAVGRNLLDLPFQDGLFDSVLAVNVLGHTEDPQDPLRFFSGLTRIVRPGGRILIELGGFEPILLSKPDNGFEPILLSKPDRGRHTDRPTIAELRWPKRLPPAIRHALSVILVAIRTTPVLKWAAHAINHYISVVWRDRRKPFWRNVEITRRNWGGDRTQSIRLTQGEYLSRLTQEEWLRWLREFGFVDVVARPCGASVLIGGMRAEKR